MPLKDSPESELKKESWENNESWWDRGKKINEKTQEVLEKTKSTLVLLLQTMRQNQVFPQGKTKKIHPKPEDDTSHWTQVKIAMFKKRAWNRSREWKK